MNEPWCASREAILFGALLVVSSAGCDAESACRPGTVARDHACVVVDAGRDAAPDAARDAAPDAVDASFDAGLDAALPGQDAAVTLDAEVPVDAAAPGLVGCQDGLLVDMRAYFFSVIGRTEGDPAPDWVEVLDTSGIPAGPGAGEVVPPDAPFYGLTQQRNSGGEVRGRIFLPTDQPDGFDYYLHAIDVLVGDQAALTWGWNDWLGGPAYVPRPCP